MNHKHLFITLCLSLIATSAFGASVMFNIDKSINYKEETECGKIEINFKHCMANNLYTFYNVYLNGQEVNSASASDNIGPFFAGGAWMGANHDFSGKKNAKTVNITFSFDGEESTKKGKRECKVLLIKVENEIYYTDDVLFCIEYMTYRVSGNSIEVWGEHHFKYAPSMQVARYYGMQSMFINETEVLTPGGKYNRWTPLIVTSTGNELRFTKSQAPNFCTYIEHSQRGYQAAYLTPDGQGDRSMVNGNDEVYIGNSWSKSYHRIIGNHNVYPGDVTKWHGIYSWFDKPLTDNCREAADTGEFEYVAYINGAYTVMSLGNDGKMTTAGVGQTIADTKTAPIAYGEQGRIVISDRVDEALCYDINGKLVYRGNGSFNCAPGVYLVSDLKGNSTKLYVK